MFSDIAKSQIAAPCGWHDGRANGILVPMRQILATTLAALGLFLLTSCGDAAADGPVGTYSLDKAAFKQQMIAAMSADMSAEQKQKLEEVFDDVEGSLELRADNTAVITMKTPNMMGGEPTQETHPGIWALDGNKITITTKENGKEEPVTGTYAAGVITLQKEENGKTMRMTFKK